MQEKCFIRFPPGVNIRTSYASSVHDYQGHKRVVGIHKTPYKLLVIAMGGGHYRESEEDF
jgi:hypothetical protein